MDIKELKELADSFEAVLKGKKTELGPQPFAWYPYDTLANFTHLEALLQAERRRLLDLIGTGPVADIGGADGEISFFLENLGCRVDLIDNARTNANRLAGANTLKRVLGSSVQIHDVDLDSDFRLPQKTYSLVIFLGVLYHLKNPYRVLEAIARSASYCLLSTRVARFSPDKQTRFAHLPVAYLLDEREANNDRTNYWIFSDAGLRRILHRTGWQICDYMTRGNRINSDPSSSAGDERAFCMLKSTVV